MPRKRKRTKKKTTNNKNNKNKNDKEENIEVVENNTKVNSKMSKKGIYEVFVNGKLVKISEEELVNQTIGATSELLDQQIMKCLMEKPMSITMIGKRLGKSYNSVSNRIADIKQGKKIKRQGLESQGYLVKIKIGNRSIYTINTEKADEVKKLTKDTELPDKEIALKKYNELKKKKKAMNREPLPPRESLFDD